jgi:hypothetical protein
MKIFQTQILLLLSTTILLGCKHTSSTNSLRVETELRLLIERNQNATRDENIEALLSTIHPESPIYEEAQRLTPQFFEMMDISSSLESINIVGIEDGFAIAKVIQKVNTKYGDNDETRENQSLAIYKNVDENWFLWDVIDTKKN